MAQHNENNQPNISRQGMLPKPPRPYQHTALEPLRPDYLVMTPLLRDEMDRRAALRRHKHPESALR